jgi:hypothetical protein
MKATVHDGPHIATALASAPVNPPSFQPMRLIMRFNLTGKSGNIFQTSEGNVLYGTYLATNGGQFNFSQLNLTGALINTGGNVQLVGGSKILTSAPFTPFQLPEIVSVFS